jgi:hypothetical protein
MMESGTARQALRSGGKKKATKRIEKTAAPHEDESEIARGDYFLSRAEFNPRILPQKSLRPRSERRAYIRRRLPLVVVWRCRSSDASKLVSSRDREMSATSSLTARTRESGNPVLSKNRTPACAGMSGQS